MTAEDSPPTVAICTKIPRQGTSGVPLPNAWRYSTVGENHDVEKFPKFLASGSILNTGISVSKNQTSGSVRVLG
jgi:hypothetical protein